MLTELLAHEGVVETSIVAGSVGIMALHGGLEAGTLELSHQLASTTGASLYSVAQPPSLWWHVPSIEYRATASQGLAAYLDHVYWSLSVHGFGRPGLESAVLIGGANRPVARRLGAGLRAGGVDAVDDIEMIPRSLRGVHSANPVNHGPEGGVQIELGSGLRTQVAVDHLVSVLSPLVVAEAERIGTG